MGGFGSGSGGGGYSGFSSNSSASMGASALSRLDLGSGSKSKDTASLTGFGYTDSVGTSRYDDDVGLGRHQALSTDEKDADGEVGQSPSIQSTGGLYLDGH